MYSQTHSESLRRQRKNLGGGNVRQGGPWGTTQMEVWYQRCHEEGGGSKCDEPPCQNHDDCGASGKES